jgi:uncharacterized membrane-anchored protein
MIAPAVPTNAPDRSIMALTRRSPEPRLPADANLRRPIHDEIHARPVQPLSLPSLVTQIAVLNETMTRADELAHLRALAEPAGRTIDGDPTLVHLTMPGCAVRWERHREFSLYVITQPVDPTDLWYTDDPDLLALVACPQEWLASIPGRTLVALQVLGVRADLDAEHRDDNISRAHRLLGADQLLGSELRDGSAQVFATYRLREDGTSRFLIMFDDVSPERAGLTATRLADLETYRTLAMMAFPATRELGPRLKAVEARLADLTRSIDEGVVDDATLLHELMIQAGQVETDLTTYSTRFAATRAYYGIVQRRIEDLRGTSVTGLTGVFTYLNRRLIPAMASVEATSDRLTAASKHLGRSADLLRTRVDITTETQNTELLRSLATGQRMQLRLQETVEGLSIAAISYYVLGIIGYGLKGLKAAGLDLDTSLVTGAAIPVVLVGVWWTLRTVKLRHRNRVDHS